MQKRTSAIGEQQHAYIVGGGIAGLAAAVLLVRDGGLCGKHVHVFEQLDQFGGSLDGAGDPESGYVIRGGRMFEAHFGCTYDLLATIPSLAEPNVSVSEEIHAFTRRIKTSSKSRLVVAGEKLEAPPFGLSWRDKYDLLKLAARREATLGAATIEDYFSDNFFTTNFWLMWSTMFAFQSWHSLVEFRRYMRRFMHLLPGFNRLEGVHRTPLNQYDSVVRPVLDWLEQQGVQLHAGTSVTAVDFDSGTEPTRVTGITVEHNNSGRKINLGERDLAFITLGCMTESSTLGSMAAPPRWSNDTARGAWGLWRDIARISPQFGRPESFAGDQQRSKWESFTVTLTDPGFFDFMETFTGNAAGSGGLVTFQDSNWRLSVVLAHQPHFANQPDEVEVFWGYALYPDRPGNRVDKPMSACSGREILEELACHLPLNDAATAALEWANCIPCAMPFITSQFMPRSRGDRPAVIPPGSANFAFLGQFCEVADDTVFTVEYSVRTAQTAVYGLLGTAKTVTPVYPGFRNPLVVLRALKALA